MALAHHRSRPGITLLEILVALVILGVGLVSLATLFPLGVAKLRDAARDSRTVALAADSEEFGETARELLARTQKFLVFSLLKGSADPKTAGELRSGYEDLTTDAAGLEARLRALRPNLPNPQVQKQADQLLAQLQAIKQLTDALAGLLANLE